MEHRLVACAPSRFETRWSKQRTTCPPGAQTGMSVFRTAKGAPLPTARAWTNQRSLGMRVIAAKLSCGGGRVRHSDGLVPWRACRYRESDPPLNDYRNSNGSSRTSTYEFKDETYNDVIFL